MGPARDTLAPGNRALGMITTEQAKRIQGLADVANTGRVALPVNAADGEPRHGRGETIRPGSEHGKPKQDQTSPNPLGPILGDDAKAAIK